ncbi:MAG TPA: glycosyltransferase family 4 protein [Candidatus Paceibacterota bacterium]|nr:glycosyltransferase family 4 protein [Candidatus Paceibacterota bacterium]
MEVAPKRILYVITLGWWGGAQRYVFDLATAAKSAGHDVFVLTGEGELRTRLEEVGVTAFSATHFQRGLGLRAELGAITSLGHAIRAVRPDIVHLNSSKAGFLGAIVARFCGVKRIIFTAHGWAFSEVRPDWQRAIFWFAHYLTLLLVDRVICVSQAVRRGTRFMPLVQGKLTVIYNGVPDIAFLTRKDAREQLAPDLPYPFWIGTIAELHPNKRVDVLIRAFAAIMDECPDAAVVIMGEGTEREHLEALVARLGLEDRIRLCGHTPKAATYLTALDLFILPSDTEALGYVLIEAGFAGLPVVASKVGGTPEIIESGIDGFLVQRRKVRAFAEAIRQLHDDPALRARFGRALKEKVAARFSQQQMVDKTLILYR